MNKRDRYQERLARHYATLSELSFYLTAERKDGKKLSVALLKMEREAHKMATDYCNGDNGVDCDTWAAYTDKLGTKILQLFGASEIPGLIINSDARGYALKIDSEYMGEYEGIGLHKDMGGNGILSPEINGELDGVYL